MSINQESAVQQPLKKQLEDFSQIYPNILHLFCLDSTPTHTPQPHPKGQHPSVPTIPLLSFPAHQGCSLIPTVFASV